MKSIIRKVAAIDSCGEQIDTAWPQLPTLYLLAGETCDLDHFVCKALYRLSILGKKLDG